jgi:hypothetical protein
MCFAAAQHTKVATRLTVLWAAVSLATQSILGRLSIDASQVGVVGEMVVRFRERVEWCSCLEAASFEVCDLVLRPVDGQAHRVTHLEEATV